MAMAIDRKDILIIISNSGNTSELTNLLKYANRFRIKIIALLRTRRAC